MSCLPPRDPRSRYPAVDRYECRRQCTQQHLTSPLISSGWYTGPQSVAKTNSIAGHVSTAEPMPNKDRRRVKDSEGYTPSRSGNQSRPKDYYYYDQGCSQLRGIIRSDLSRSEGYKLQRRDAYVARSQKEPFIKNGTLHTSYQLDKYASACRSAEDLLSEQHRYPGAPVWERATSGSDNQSAKRKSRQETIQYKQIQPPSEKHLSIFPGGRSERLLSSDADRQPALPSPPATDKSSHHRRDTKPSRKEVEEKESIKQESMNVDAVEEEITCPM